MLGHPQDVLEQIYEKHGSGVSYSLIIKIRNHRYWLGITHQNDKRTQNLYTPIDCHSSGYKPTKKDIQFFSISYYLMYSEYCPSKIHPFFEILKSDKVN